MPWRCGGPAQRRAEILRLLDDRHARGREPAAAVAAADDRPAPAEGPSRRAALSAAGAAPHLSRWIEALLPAFPRIAAFGHPADAAERRSTVRVGERRGLSPPPGGRRGGGDKPRRSP